MCQAAKFGTSDLPAIFIAWGKMDCFETWISLASPVFAGLPKTVLRFSFQEDSCMADILTTTWPIQEPCFPETGATNWEKARASGADCRVEEFFKVHPDDRVRDALKQ